MRRTEPNERKLPDFDQADWDRVLEWRVYVYQLIKKFGTKTLGMGMWLSGDFTTNEHRWIMQPGPHAVAYGIDAVAIMEDLESAAWEGALLAAHEYDDTKGFTFSTFLTKVVNRELQHAFDRWLRTSASKPDDVGIVRWGRPGDGPHIGEPNDFDPEGAGINDEWDPQYAKGARPHESRDTSTSLPPEAEEGLARVAEALTSKENWALRMVADGVPADEIAVRLGYKDPKSVYRLIERAKRKAREAYDDH